MWIKIITIFVLVFNMHHTDANMRRLKRYVSSGAGSFAGASLGTETYSRMDGAPLGFFNFPGFPYPALQHQNEFNSLPYELHRAASMTYATQDATAFASASLFPSDNFVELYQQKFDGLRQNARHVAGQNGQNYASAYGSYGPDGVQQSTYINPPNPLSPNVNVMYRSSGGPGYHSVSSSSFSESSNVNGQPLTRRGAVSTVNDNGKITTYQSYS